uniref:Uncharacterized protein n=1 Tax=Kalanchoe fedtschenkoi TaxID=63787 RepID=A0A7N0VEK9_KALFE
MAAHRHGVPAHGHWTTSLCGCFEDCGNCCMTFCCPCVTFGRNAEIIDQGATTCCGGCCVFAILAEVGCACLYSCSYRSKLRQQYSLPDQPCGDCCVHFLCGPCALCQEHRELRNRGFDPSAGWASHAHKMNAPSAVTGPS